VLLWVLFSTLLHPQFVFPFHCTNSETCMGKEKSELCNFPWHSKKNSSKEVNNIVRKIISFTGVVRYRSGIFIFNRCIYKYNRIFYHNIAHSAMQGISDVTQMSWIRHDVILTTYTTTYIRIIVVVNFFKEFAITHISHFLWMCVLAFYSFYFGQNSLQFLFKNDLKWWTVM
jgi:hypothetical protein